MAIKILNENNLGLGLEKDSNTKKLQVKIKEGSALRLDALGLDVVIPQVQIPEVPVAIAKIEIEGNNIKVTDTKENTLNVALPAQTVDVKLQGAEVTADNKLKLTLSSGDIVEADLSKFVDAPKTAQEYWTEQKALSTFAKDIADAVATNAEAKAVLVKALLKEIVGVEVQDFEDNSVGYLLKAPAVSPEA